MEIKIKLWLWLLLLLFVLSPGNVYAQMIYSCDYGAKARHQSLASNVNFDVDYIEKINTVEFVITITNLHPEIKMIDIYHDVTYQYNDFEETPKELKIKGFADNNVVKFEFHSRDPVCQTNHLLTQYVKLPPYNKYYKDSLCEGIEECNLCKKWVENKLSYNEFKNGVLKYKQELRIAEKKKSEQLKKESSVIIKYINIIAKFIVSNYIYILIGLIFLGSVISYIVYKKQEFRF